MRICAFAILFRESCLTITQYNWLVGLFVAFLLGCFGGLVGYRAMSIGLCTFDKSSETSKSSSASVGQPMNMLVQ